MPFQVNLIQGSHVLGMPVVHWRADWIDQLPVGIKLTASIQSPLPQMTGMSPGQRPPVW